MPYTPGYNNLQKRVRFKKSLTDLSSVLRHLMQKKKQFLRMQPQLLWARLLTCNKWTHHCAPHTMASSTGLGEPGVYWDRQEVTQGTGQPNNDAVLLHGNRKRFRCSFQFRSNNAKNHDTILWETRYGTFTARL